MQSLGKRHILVEVLIVRNKLSQQIIITINFMFRGPKNKEENINHLLEIMEIIACYAGYSRYIERSTLFDYQTYFQICQLIFPEHSIKIIKIQQFRLSEPEQKLQQLIDLLSYQLNIELNKNINGHEIIINQNLAHIQVFLQLLYMYSKIYMESKNRRYGVRSDAGKNNGIKQNDQHQILNSARDPHRNYQIDNATEYEISNRNSQDVSSSNQPQPLQQKTQQPKQNKQQQRSQFQTQKQQYLMKQKQKSRSPVYSADKKRERNYKLSQQNLHTGVVNLIMDEKTKMLKTSVIDNRKNKMEDIQLAKNQYKSYLKNFAKGNRVAKNRQNHLNHKARVKSVRQQLPKKDFQKIENFFEAFTYKFRDKKVAYLRKMKQIIRRQEQDRYCYQNRIQKQTKKYMESRLKQDIDAQNHQYRVRSSLMKENQSKLQQNISVMRKQQKMRTSRQKKELKQSKKKEMQQIEYALNHENERVLMSLEQGGRLEQIIMQIYKRF